MRVTAALLSVVVLQLAVGCEVVTPTNPYDPQTPANEQERAAVTGEIELRNSTATETGLERDLAAIRIGLLGVDGRPLTENDEPLQRELTPSAAGRGRFNIGDLDPGSYTLVVRNIAPFYEPPVIAPIVVLPGETADVGTLTYTFAPPDGCGPGSISGTIDADGGGVIGQRTVSLFTNVDTVRFVDAQVSSDGAFTFPCLPTGTYAVVGESDGYTPDYRLDVEVGVGSSPLAQTFDAEAGLRLFPVSAVLVPVAGPGVRIEDGRAFIAANDAPLAVLAFGGVDEMRLSTNAAFVDDGGNTIPFAPFNAATSVPLPAREGPLEIFAQFLVRSEGGEGFEFTSEVFTMTLVRDVTAPEVLGVSARGLQVDGDIALASDGGLTIDVDGQDVVSAIDAISIDVDGIGADVFSDVSSAGGRILLPQALNLVADGEHLITARLRDLAGNVSAPGTVRVLLDREAPQTSFIVDNAIAGTLHERRARLVFNDADGDGAVQLDLELVRGNGAVEELVRDDPFVGAVEVDLPTPRDGERVTLRARLTDLVGNVATIDSPQLLLSFRGRVVGAVAVDGVPDVVADAAGVQVVALDGAGATLQTTTTGVDGSFALVGVPEAAAVFVEARRAGWNTARTGIGPVTAQPPTALPIDAGRLALTLETGTLVVDARLDEAAADDTAHAGIVVTIALEGGARATERTDVTDAAGRARFVGLPATLSGEQYTIVASADRHQPATTTTSVVPGVVTTSAPLRLTELTGAFDICPGSTGACVASSFANTDEVRVRLRGAVATAIRARAGNPILSTTPEAELPFVPLTDLGADVVDISGQADGVVSVFVQFQSGPGVTSEVLVSTLIKDTLAPAPPTATLLPAASALDPRFTRFDNVDVIIDGDAGTGDVAPLARARVVVADVAPAQAPATPGACDDARACTVALPTVAGAVQEKLHNIHAFACDQAGNCSSSSSTSVIHDRTPPKVDHGASFAIDGAGAALVGGVRVLRSALYTATLGTGTARDAGGAVVRLSDSTPVADVWGYRLSFLASGIDVPTRTLSPSPTPAQPRSDVIGPALPNSEDEVTMFAVLVDAAGNEITTPLSVRLRIDATPPEANVTLRAPDGNLVATTTNQVRIVVTPIAEAPARVQLDLDADGAFDDADLAFPFVGGADVQTLPIGADGPVVVGARLVDAVGNATTRAATILVDRSAPDVISLSCTTCRVVNGALFSTAATAQETLAVIASDGAGSGAVALSISVNGGAPTTVQSPTTAAALLVPDSVNQVVVRAVDRAGLVSSDAQARSLTIVHDQQRPTFTVTVAGGAAVVNDPDVTVRIDNAPADVVGMRLSSTATFAGPDLPFNPTTSFSLPFPDDIRTVFVELVDAAGNRDVRSDDVRLDTVAPAGSLVVPSQNGGFVTTSSFSVNATLDGATRFAIGVEPFDCPATLPALPTLPVTQGPFADGALTLVGCFGDVAGNIASDRLTLTVDTQAPNARIAVDGGAAFTIDTSVDITVADAADVVAALFAEGAVNCATATLVPFDRAQTPTVSLSAAAADGARTVTGCFADAAGNRSTATDTVVLDRLDPAGSLVIAGGATFVRGIPGRPGDAVDVNAELVGASADVVGLALAVGDLGCGSAVFGPFSSLQRVSLSVDGTTTVTACLRDQAGRTAKISDTVVLDRVPPVGTVVLNDGAASVTTLSVNARFTADADVTAVALLSGDVDCELVTGSDFVGIATLSPPLTKQVTLSGGGPQTATACFRDAADNRRRASDAIDVDLSSLNQVIVIAGGGADFSRSANVLLNVLAPADAQTSKIVVDQSNVDANGNQIVDVCEAGTFTAFQQNPTVTGLGNGVRTIGVCVRTPTRTLFAEDTIEVDTQAPTGTLTLAAGAARTRTELVLAELTFDADVDAIAVTNAPSIDCGTASFEPATASRSVTLPGPDNEAVNTIRACLRDRAGNTTVVSDSIIFDRLPPQGVAVVLVDDVSVPAPSAGFLHRTGVKARATLGTGTTQIAVAEGLLDCGAATFTAASGVTVDVPLTLSAGDATKSVTACFKDAVGNVAAATGSAVLDTSVPVGRVVLANGADTVAVRTSVPVLLEAPSDVHLASVAEAATLNCATATYQAFAPSSVITLSAGDGSKTVSVCLKDDSGRTFLATDAVFLDETRPTGTLTLSGNGQTGFTSSTQIGAAIASADAVEMAISTSSIDCDNVAYAALASTATLTLPSGDGSKTVFLCLRDRAGNRSLVTTASITLDQTPPAANANTVTIAGGAAFTTSVTTALSIAFSADAVERAVQNDGLDCSSATYTAFVGASPQAVASHTLAAGDGNKLVAVCFRDRAGNTTLATDSIVLDTVAPSSLDSSLVINGGAARTTSAALSLALLVPSDVDGVAYQEGALSQATCDAQGVFEAPSSPRAFNLGGGADGTRIVSACVREKAGRRIVVSDSIILDATRPTLTSVTLDGAASGGFTRDRTVDVVVVGASADVASMAVADADIADCAAATYAPFSATFSRSLPGVDGSKTVSVCLKDETGNVSASSTEATITLDTAAPAGVTVDVPATTTTTAVSASLTYAATGAGLATRAAVAEGAIDCSTATRTALDGSSPDARALTLSAGDGAKAVVACFYDEAGNFVAAAPDTVLLDTRAPSVSTVTCTNCTVDGSTIFLAGTTATVAVTSDEAGSGLAATALVAVDGVEAARAVSGGVVTITGLTNGTHTIRVRLTDVAGNSTAIADGKTVSVLVDTVRPALASNADFRINDANSGTSTSSTSVAVTIANPPADATQMAVVESASALACASASYVPLVTAFSFNLAGTSQTLRTLQLCLQDRAGNTSSVAHTATTTFDSVPPSLPATNALVIDNADADAAHNAFLTTTSGVQIGLDWNTAGDVVAFKVSEGFADCSEPLERPVGIATVSAFTKTDFVLSAVDGNKIVFACFVDAAGNTVTTSNSSVLDQVGANGAVAVNGGAAFTTDTSENVTVTLRMGTDTARFALVETANAACTTPTLTCSSASFQSVSGATVVDGALQQTVALNLSGGSAATQGGKCFEACFEDAAGNRTAAASLDGITFDTVAPSATATLAGLSPTAGLTRSPFVTLTLTGAAADTTQLRVSEDSGFLGGTVPFESFSATRAVALSPNDGAKQVNVQLKDAAGNTSSLAINASITLDTQPPSGTAAVINSGAAATSSATVSLFVQATGATERLILTPDNPADTEAFAAFAISPATINGVVIENGVAVGDDGGKTVLVVFRDAAGNEAAAAVDTIELDRSAPAAATLTCGTGTSTGVCVNAGAAATNSVSASLTLAATGATEMSIATDGCADGEADEPFVPFSSAIQALLDGSTQGTKTIAVRFRDAAGNVSQTFVSCATTPGHTRTITFDTGAPSGVLVALASSNPADPSGFTTTGTVTGTFTRGDATSFKHGQAVDCSTAAGYAAISGVTQAVSGIVLAGGDGLKPYFACFKDDAGNATSATASITVDTSAPTGTLTLANGADPIGSAATTATLTFSSDTTGILVQNTALASCPTTAGSYAIAQPTISHALTAGSGTKTVFACLRDAAGNVSSVLTDTVTVDVTPPTLTSFTVNGSAGTVTTASTTVTLAIDATDTNGPVTMAVSNTPLTCATASYTSLSTSFSHQLPVSASTTINLCLKDGLGVTSAAPITRLVNLDQQGPAGTVELRTAAGVASELVNSLAVAVRVNLSAAESGVQRKIANDAVDCGNSAGYAALEATLPANVAHTLSSGDGTKTVFVCFKDAVGNVTLVSDTIVLDTTPPSALLALDNGAAVSLDTTVTANFSSVVDVSQTRFFTTTPGTCPTPFSGYAAFVNGGNQTVSQGTTTIFVCLADAAGNTTLVQDSIDVDTTDPTIAVALARRGTPSPDPLFTSTREVTVTVTPTSLAQGSSIAIANAGTLSCQDAATSYTLLPSPLPSSITVDFNLAAGGSDGSRAVAVCVKEPSGRTNGTTGTATSIELDTAPPDVAVTINSGDAITGSDAVTLAFAPSPAADPLRFITSRDPSEDCAQATYSGAFGNVSGGGAFTLLNGAGLDDSGTKFAVGCFQDRAGNTAAGFDDIFFDEDKPTFGSSRPVCTSCNLVDANAAVANTFGDPYLGFTNAASTVTFDVQASSGDVAFVLAMATTDVDQSQANGLGEDRACTLDSQCNTGLGESCELFPVKDSPQLLLQRCVLLSTPDAVTAPIIAADGKNAVVLALEDEAGNLSVGRNVRIVRDRVAPQATFALSGGGDIPYTITSIDDTGAAGTVNITLSTAHSLVVGDPLIVSGVDDGVVTYNGAYTVAAVIGTTQIRTAQADPGGAGVLEAGRTSGTLVQPITRNLGAFVKNLTITGETAEAGVLQLGTFRASALSTLADAATLDYTDVTAPFELADAIPVTLTAGDGAKTVFVEFLDNAGNSVTATVPTMLDATAPTDPLFANATTLIDGDETVSILPLAIPSTDTHLLRPRPLTVSGFANVIGISDTDVSCAGTQCTWNGTGAFDIDDSNVSEGENRLRVNAVDAAGNASNVDFFIITKDSTPPAPPSNLLKSERSGAVSLRWTASPSPDVAFYEVLYGFDSQLSGAFAAEGTSPVAVANTQIALTSLSDNNPFLVQIRAVDAAGNRSTVTPANPGLQCLSNPVAPDLVGTLNRSGAAITDKIVVDGVRAVALKGSSVCLYNLATPAAPTELSCTNPSALAGDRLTLHGRHVYLMSQTNSLKVATISGTSIGAFTSQTLETNNTNVPASASNLIHDMAFAGHTAIGIRENPNDGGELVVLEQVPAGAASVAGSLEAAQVLSATEDADVAIAATTRLAIGKTYGALLLPFLSGTFVSAFDLDYDLSSTRHGARITDVENILSDSVGLLGNTMDVQISDNLIFAATTEGLSIIERGTDTLTTIGVLSGFSCTDLDVLGGYAFCADGESNRFVVVSFVDPTAPRIAGQGFSPSKIVSIDANENLVYTLGEDGALRVFELWAPTRFVQGRNAGVLEYQDAFMDGNVVVQQAVNGVVQRFDISDPESATVATSTGGTFSPGLAGRLARHDLMAVTGDPDDSFAFRVVNPYLDGTAASVVNAIRNGSTACISGARTVDITAAGNIALAVTDTGKVESWALDHRSTSTVASVDADDTLNGPVTLTFPTSHDLQVGEKLTVTGAAGFNGNYTVGSVVSSTVIVTTEEDPRVENDTDCATAVAHGALNRSRAESINSITDGAGASVLTIGFGVAHGFVVGEPIVVSGTTGYNGNYTVASVPNSLTLTTTTTDPGGGDDPTENNRGTVTGALNVSSINDTSTVLTVNYSAGVVAVDDTIEILTDSVCTTSTFNGRYTVATDTGTSLTTVQVDSDNNALAGVTVERPGALQPACIGEVVLANAREISDIVDGKALVTTTDGALRLLSVNASTGAVTLETSQLTGLGIENDGFGAVENRGAFGYVSRASSPTGSLRRFTISGTTLTQTHVFTGFPVGGLGVAGRVIAGADGTRDSAGAPGKVAGLVFFVENASGGFDIISRVQALRAPYTVVIGGNTLVTGGTASMQVMTVSR